MKTKLLFTLCFIILHSSFILSACAQGTAFTYQGQLVSGGSPASGTYNLTFSLFNVSSGGVPIAGPLTNNAVGVTNGLFTVPIDFGSGAWNGQTNWLEIAVETNLAGSFITLAPRQQLTPTPYAIYAESVTASGIVGTLTNAQLLHSAVTVNPGPGLSGGGKVTLGNTITLTNTGVLSVTGNADITASTVGGAVTLNDNATSADARNTLVLRDGSGNFSAYSITLDGVLTLPAVTPGSPDIIYSGSALLLYDDLNGNSFIGASAGNSATSGGGNTANGAQALSSNTSGSGNTANGFTALYFNTNGIYNTANGNQALFYNTSGNWNTANGYAALLSNASGSNNTANGVQALYDNVTGNNNTANGVQSLYANAGSDNTANGEQALYANQTGNNNTANGVQALYDNFSGSGNTANGYHALFMNTSGSDNTANGRAALYNNTTGTQNTADGVQALNDNTNGSGNIALGYRAGYNITGSGNIDIDNEGASGDNYIIRIGTVQTATYLVGTVYANGVALTSDRNAKENFTAVNAREVLAKVAALPVTEWNYKSDGQAVQHLGPMAQDFQAAFSLNGGDDKHISVVDEGGVALAAIQGLNEKVDSGKQQAETQIQELRAENAELKQKNSSLEKRLEALEQILLKQKPN